MNAGGIRRGYDVVQGVHLAQSRPGIAFRDLTHAVSGVLLKLVVVN